MEQIYLNEWEKLAMLVRYEIAREESDNQPIIAGEWRKIGQKILARIAEADREAKGYGV